MMDIIYFVEGIPLFILGTIFGSFLNVVILRFLSSQTLAGRSGCMSCEKKLHWYDLIPIVSYLSLRGKCRTCSSSISLQYIFVELLSGLLTMCIGMYYLEHILRFVLVITILYSCIVLAVLDSKHQLLPNMLLLFLVLVCGVFGFMQGVPLLSAFFVCALPILILVVLTRGRGMGEGDIVLAGCLGLVLGIQNGFVALWLSFIIGALWVCSFMCAEHLLRKTNMFGITRLVRAENRTTMKSSVAFGPFIFAAGALVWILYLNGYEIALWNDAFEVMRDLFEHLP